MQIDQKELMKCDVGFCVIWWGCENKIMPIKGEGEWASKWGQTFNQCDENGYNVECSRKSHIYKR